MPDFATKGRQQHWFQIWISDCLQMVVLVLQFWCIKATGFNIFLPFQFWNWNILKCHVCDKYIIMPIVIFSKTKTQNSQLKKVRVCEVKLSWCLGKMVNIGSRAVLQMWQSALLLPSFIRTSEISVNAFLFTKPVKIQKEYVCLI